MPDFPIDPELRIHASPPVVLRRTAEAVEFLRKMALRQPRPRMARRTAEL